MKLWNIAIWFPGFAPVCSLNIHFGRSMSQCFYRLSGTTYYYMIANLADIWYINKSWIVIRDFLIPLILMKAFTVMETETKQNERFLAILTKVCYCPDFFCHLSCSVKKLFSRVMLFLTIITIIFGTMKNININLGCNRVIVFYLHVWHSLHRLRISKNHSADVYARRSRGTL